MPRRRLRNRRDLHRLDVEPGDVALSLDDYRTWYFVVGVRPEGWMEVVRGESVQKTTGNWQEFGDVLDAISNDRLVTYTRHQNQLGPMPSRLFEKILDDD